jgi:energy-coupling factor transporter ATP-binding protein EcfA2/energy-coupling factor transporter transmembrane protein EcfT
MDPHRLSGGQRQRLAVAVALAGGARVLILDEPLSSLDPVHARELLNVLKMFPELAIVMVEHRLELALPWATRTVLLDKGRVVANPLSRLESLEALGLNGPGLVELERRVPGPWIKRKEAIRAWGEPAGEPVLSIENLQFSYEKPLFSGLDLTIRTGERVALVGANGSGKSTLLQLITGQLQGKGRIERKGRIVAVPQNPDLALFCSSVAEELGYAPQEAKCPVESMIQKTATALSLQDLLDRPPQALSKGQRLRVAVAAALAAEPGLLILDEPTAGQDKEQVDRMFQSLVTSRTTLLFACHDLEVVARYATRVYVVGKGLEGPPLSCLLQSGLPLPGLVQLCAALKLPVMEPKALAEYVATGPGFSVETLPASIEDAQPPLPVIAAETTVLSARTRLIIAGSLALIGLCLEGTFALSLLAIPPAALLLLHPRTRGYRLALLGTAGLLIWSTAISQGLFWAGWPQTPWLGIFYREGVLHGLTQSLRFVGSLSIGGLLLATTGINRLLGGLGMLGVPGGLGLLGAMALRAVPMVGQELLSVRRARAMRGRPIWKRKPWAWLNEEARLLLPVVARAIRRSQALGESLDTRGFSASRLVIGQEPETRLDVLVMGGCCVLTATTFFLRILIVLYQLDWYYHPALRPIYGWVRAWM